MELNHKFDILRPYNDSEVKSALSRILGSKNFRNIISYLYPDNDIDETLSIFRQIETVNEFQLKFSDYAVKKILEITSDGLTISGIDNLVKGKSYLFIANHRDIVMDAAIMQTALLNNGHKTSQITFGSNLMTSDFIVDLGKLNKMFTFYRGGSKLEIYKNALLHSAYISDVLKNKNESIWLAQRDGRTKDGNDKTQKSLIRMLLAGRRDYIQALKDLNIVPVTISYEYEPCDYLKVNECYVSRKERYKKTSNEDLNSILVGIMGKKGAVHIAFGQPIKPILNELEEIDFNELASIVCDEIDNQIHQSYALQKGNYIAWDLLKNDKKYFEKKYSQNDKYEFSKYIDNQIAKLVEENSELRRMFIEMYANPVINYRSVLEKNRIS